MVIICPHCQKEHSIDESRLPANVTKVRCKFCKEQFDIVSPKPSAAAVQPAATTQKSTEPRQKARNREKSR